MTIQFDEETGLPWINRYIMECKLYYELNEEQIIDRINRYIMECKFS